MSVEDAGCSCGTNRTTIDVRSSVANGSKPDMAPTSHSVEFNPERNLRTGRRSLDGLRVATSKRTGWVHRQRELKRGTVGYICRGPEAATMGLHDRTAD